MRSSGSARGCRIIRDRARAHAASGHVVGFLVAVAVVSIGLMVVQASIANTFASKVSEYENVDLQNIVRRALSNLLDWSGQPRTWVDEPNASRVQWVGLAVPGTHQTVDLEKVWHAFKLRETDNDFTRVLNRTMGLPEGMKWRFEMEPVYRVEENLTVESLQNYRVAYIGQFNGLKDPDYTGETNESKNDRYEIERAGVGFTNWLATFEPGANWSKGDVYPADPDALAPHLALRLAGFPFALDQKPTDAPGLGGVLSKNSYWNVINTSTLGSNYHFGNDPPAHVLSVANANPSGSPKWSTQDSGTDRVIMGPFDFTLAKNASVHLTHHVQTTPSSVDPAASIQYYCVKFCDGSKSGEWVQVHPNAEWASRGDPQSQNGPFWEEDGFRMDDVKGRVVYLALTYTHGRTAEGQPGWLVRNVSVMEERGYSRWSTVYENRLDYKTREYDAIVVGTGVVHMNLDDRAMTSPGWHGAFYDASDAWSRAGGDLLVLGSDSADPGWLARPDMSVRTVDTRIAVLDEDDTIYEHQLLSSPHMLNPRQLGYADGTLARSGQFNGSVAVTVHTGDPDDDREALFLSELSPPVRSGGVVLTAVAPQSSRMESPEDRTRFFVNAFAALAFQHHYVSAGNDIADGTLVASSSRVVLVDGVDEQIPYNAARATLWVWN